MNELDQPATIRHVEKVREEMTAMEQRLLLQIADSAQRTIDVILGTVRDELRADMVKMGQGLERTLRGEVGAEMKRIGEEIKHDLRAELGADLQRHSDALFERLKDLFRGAGDETRALADRVAAQETALADHVGDRGVHRRPRRAPR